MNLDNFSKVVGRSCIIDELRESIFCTYLCPPAPLTKQVITKKRSSLQTSKDLELKRIEDERLLERASKTIFVINPNIKFSHGYYKNDLKILDDVSFG